MKQDTQSQARLVAMSAAELHKHRAAVADKASALRQANPAMSFIDALVAAERELLNPAPTPSGPEYRASLQAQIDRVNQIFENVARRNGLTPPTRNSGGKSAPRLVVPNHNPRRQ